MQKKLLAVAVAGALGAPAVALAQSSNATVNIYGVMYMEYAVKVNQGNNGAGLPLTDPDMLQTPGSAIGFRGEEKLGGGLSAWFQCETTADIRSQTTQGLCSRNSALGLKGGFGNLFIGGWDTPFKRVQEATGSNDTGVYGSAFVLMGNSTTTGIGSAAPGVFKRRQNSQITYESPNFGGFQVMGAFTSTNAATGVPSSVSGNKPRVWSLAAKYANGPLNVYGGYERHNDFTGPGALRVGDETGWVVGASYTFANNLKLGGLYSRQSWEGGTPAIPTEGRVRTWHLGIDWMISGPHGVRAAYSAAGDIHGFGAAALPVRPAFSALGDTDANLWQIRYVHQLSKRTELTAGYVRLNNGARASYQLGGLALNGLGQDQSAFALAMYHRF